MSEATPDLTLLTQLMRQVIADVGTIKDDMRVLTAIVMRQDNTLAAMLTELRAMHSQHSRLANRVSALEAAAQQ